MDIIRKHGPVSRHEMFRRGFKVPDREFDEALRALVDNGLVLKTREATVGRPTERYAAAAAVGDEAEEDGGD